MTSPKCIVPWTQIEVCATGYARPCAEYLDWLVDDNGNRIDLNNPDTTLDDAWNNKEYKKLRQQYINGEQPAGCRKCFSQEEQGILSRRQRELEVHGKHLHLMESTDAPDPVLFDLKLGNHCNLKCKICCSEFSTKWEDTELELFGQVINANCGKNWVQQQDNWNSILDISNNAEVLYLSGGEPFLIDEHRQLINHLIAQDKAKDIWIKYHTNGTFKLTDELLEQFAQFKRIQLHYSIDDIGQGYEYQRTPAKWQRIEENIKHALEQDVDIRITYTVSLLNCLSGAAMEQWCNSVGIALDQIDINFLHDPVYYNISALSKQQKDYIKQLLGDGWIDREVYKFMDTQHQEDIKDAEWKVNSREELDNLRRYVILSLDKKSKLNLENVSPEIAELVYAGHTRSKDIRKQH